MKRKRERKTRIYFQRPNNNTKNTNENEYRKWTSLECVYYYYYYYCDWFEVSARRKHVSFGRSSAILFFFFSFRSFSFLVHILLLLLRYVHSLCGCGRMCVVKWWKVYFRVRLPGRHIHSHTHTDTLRYDDDVRRVFVKVNETLCVNLTHK